MGKSVVGHGKRIPVIILTGFLGSGKTTLLNRLLASPRGARVAIVVNEYAEVGIDHHLMLTSKPYVMQANNGCICCGVRGDLIAGLFRLIELRENFDTLVIELSGMADPVPVAQALYADERIRSEFFLQGVVTVVDAKHVGAQLDDTVEAETQVAFADLIVLNKVDLVDADELDEIEGAMRLINISAPIVRSRDADLDLDLLLNVAPPQQRAKGAFLCEAIESAPNESARARHTAGIETISIVKFGELDGRAVSLWFREIMTSMGARLMRMKGVLSFEGDPDRFFFQGVWNEFEGRPGPRWGEEDRVNRLVFIGRKLNRHQIETGFDACLAKGNLGNPCPPSTFDFHDEISPLRLEQIRYWLRQNFGLEQSAPIVIKEVPCMKPSCPPVETAIVAMVKDEPPRLFKIQHKINEITFDHVYDLMENPMPCC